jgi:hypothetical protein
MDGRTDLSRYVLHASRNRTLLLTIDDWRGGLRMSKFFAADADVTGFFSIVE